MKAVRLHAYGAPDVLVYEDAPDPIPQAGELVVDVAAVGVNPADYKFRSGIYAQIFAKVLPLTLGMDVAGAVRSVGDGVVGFAPGDRVLAMIPHTHKGGYAERVAAPAAFFARLPEGLDWADAAALSTPGTTAIELIEDDLAVGPGQRILVTGATGAVGRVAVYCAKRCGAHVTAAVRTRSKDDVRWADDILLIDGPDDPSLIGYDAIADTVGGSLANSMLRRLRAGGTLSSVSTFPVGDTRGLDVVSRRFACHPDPARLAILAEAVARGDLTLPPVRRMKLSEAAEAHRLLEQGGVGKIVLIPDRAD